MGYKLAGFEHLGGVEIDPKVADAYKANHKPKHLFIEDIRNFNEREDLPSELYDLDILDGSPPCSTFSMSGSREKAWGNKKQFREGQALQTLDDLVFVYCNTIAKLKPKVFLLENVKGIIQGNAKWYSTQIVSRMEEQGYSVQVFLLNAASMGVPQKRERVFFIGHKKELAFPKLVLEFKERAILFGEVMEKGCKSKECFQFPESERTRLNLVKKGDRTLAQADYRLRGGSAFFNQALVYEDKVCSTVLGQEKQFCFSEKRRLSNNECMLIGSYPLDYNFKGLEPKYLIGMSVPPIMTAQIAHQIWLQWLSKVKE
jgi:DNA (cytosine-5)-methyltransferase 1